MDNGFIIFLMCVDIAFFIKGIYLLLKRPTIFRFDKTGNICTKETKGIWQKEYKIIPICKLSDIEKVIEMGKIGRPELCIQLKSGSSITLLSESDDGEKLFTEKFILEANKINDFLRGRRQKYEFKFSLASSGKSIIILSLICFPLIYYATEIACVFFAILCIIFFHPRFWGRLHF